MAKTNEGMAEKLAIIQKDTTNLVDMVKSLKIKTTEDMTQATDVLVKIVARKKRVEELRQFFVKPLNDQVKLINAEFKKAGLPLMDMEADIKKKIVEYRKIEAEKLEAERKKAEEKRRKEWEKEQEKLRKQREKEAEKEKARLAKLELSKKDEKAELKRIEDEKKAKEEEAQREEFNFDDGDFQQSKSVYSENGSVKMRKQWTFRIVDQSKVPSKYLVVDERLIRADVKAGIRNIDGVDIYEEEIVGANT